MQLKISTDHIGVRIMIATVGGIKIHVIQAVAANEKEFDTHNGAKTSKMSAYTIEKNIPIPKKPGKKCKYPFDKLNISESFFVELESGIALKRLQMKLSNAASNYSAYRNRTIQFQTAQLENGVRVWRIK